MAEQQTGGQGNAQAGKADDAKAAPPSSAGAPTDALAASVAALIKAAEKKPTSTADPLVSAAFALGWHMSELYEAHGGKDRNPPDLPGLSDLDRVPILIDQVEVGVHKLSDSITQAGLPAVALTDLDALLPAQPDATGQQDPTKAILSTHEQLLGDLTAADFRLGKAYGLGRALADSCREPADLAGLKKELNPYRIANLLSWLDDLETALPPHAAHSVKESLTRWRDAIYPTDRPAPQADKQGPRKWLAWLKEAQTRADHAESAARRPSKPLAEHTTEQMATALSTGERDTVSALRRQGELWRALLSGEKQGTDMLEIDNYLDAAKQVLARAGGIIWRAIAKMPAVSLSIGLLLAGGVALLILGSTTQLVGGVTSILVALGLTWKGLGTTLGQLVGKLEQPLWGAVLNDAIADAITLLPGNNAEKGGRRKVALDMPPTKRSDGH